MKNETHRILLFFYRLLTVIEFDLQKTFFQYLKLLKKYDTFLKAADKNMICIDRFKPDILTLYTFNEFLDDEYQKYDGYFGSKFIFNCFDKIFLDFLNKEEDALVYDIILKKRGGDKIKLYFEWSSEFLYTGPEPRKYIRFLRTHFNRLDIVKILQKLNFEISLYVDYSWLEIFFKKK